MKKLSRKAIKGYAEGGEPTIGDSFAGDDPKYLKPNEWIAINKARGYKPITTPRPSPYPEFYDPNKFYQKIDEKGNVIDLPYESYTPNYPKKPAVSADHKPLDIGPNLTYNPNTGQYYNPVTQTNIQPIIEQYRKGGKVKGYALAGEVTDPNNPYVTPQNHLSTPQGQISLSGPGSYQYAFSNINSQQPVRPSNNKPSYYSQLQERNKKDQGSAKNAQLAQQAGAAALVLGNQMYKDPYSTPERDKTETTIDTAAASLTPWYGLAKGASDMGRSVLKKDEYGFAQGNYNRAADDLLKPQHEYAIDAYRREGIGGAAKEFFTPVGAIRAGTDLLSKDDETTGFWGKLNKFSGNAAQNKERQDIIDVEQQKRAELAEQERLRKEAEQKAIQQSVINEAKAKRDAGNVGYNDGGLISGPGTGTSDSIKAKVKPGSFIVPAKNSEIAKRLGRDILGINPKKKANLNQGGGIEVKLSDGEIMWTPEQKAELEENGVDVSALAPDAKSHLYEYMKCGGMVKNYKYSKGGMAGFYEKTVKGYATGGEVDDDDYAKKELAKIEAQRKADAKKIGEIEANRRAVAARYKLEREIQSRLQIQNDAKKAASESFNKAKTEYDAIKKAYEDYVAESDMELGREDGSKKYVGYSGKPEKEDVLNEREKLLKKLQDKESEMNKAQSDLDYANNERNFINQDISKLAEATYGRRSGSAPDYLGGDKTSAGKQPVIPVKTGAEIEADVRPQTTTPRRTAPAMSTDSLVNALRPGVYGDTENVEVPAAQTAPVQEQVPLDEYSYLTRDFGTTPAPKADENKRFNFDPSSILGSAINYGIPLAQTLIGLRNLKKAGERPVDKIDQGVYNAISTTAGDVQSAREAARYGFTGQERNYLDSQNAALLSAGRQAARNYSGGSAANAYNLERQSINDAYGRGLMSQVQDRNLQLQKQRDAIDRQQYANQLAFQKQELQRRLFNDSLNAWNQDTSSAANLVNTGLTNAIDGYRSNERLKSFENMQKQATSPTYNFNYGQ